MKNSLLYLSKNDIPFREAQVNIHQPTINEISLIGEESFHIGCQFLIFSSDKLVDKDKLNLGNKTDFEIFMSVMNSRQKAIHKTDAVMVLEFISYALCATIRLTISSTACTLDPSMYF